MHTANASRLLFRVWSPSLVASCLVAVGGCISSTGVSAGASEPAPFIDAAAIRAHVEYLASDALEGRAAGSPGFEMAARYVAAQFEEMGLKPGGDHGSWFQEVPLLEGLAVIRGSAVRVMGGETSIDLESKVDYLPRAQYVEADATVTAQAVFVGFGISAPELRYDDFSKVDVRGRIAVILGGAPTRFPANRRAYYSSTLYKYGALSERGAVGVIAFDTPPNEKRRPWARAVQHSWIPGMRWVDESGVPAEAFPELRGKFLFSRAGASKLFEGAHRSLPWVFSRAKRGKSQGFELPCTVTLTTKTLLTRNRSANVAGLLEGSDPRLKSEYIVFTAHLDHVGKGAPIEGDGVYNGAFDNASGTAIMIEMARHLASLPTPPRRSMIFLAVTAEERGLVGSDYFARNPTVPAGNIVANVNMDMPIAPTALRDIIAYGSEHSTLGAVAARAVRLEGMKLSPDPFPDEVSFVRSDQYSFVRQGIPALDLGTGIRARDRRVDAIELIADFLRNRYHMPGDDASQAIDYGTLAALGRVNARIARAVANADDRPKWKRGDFFGELFGARRAAALAEAEARPAAEVSAAQ